MIKRKADRSGDYAITAAPNGASGLEAARAEVPPLIVLDLLPRMARKSAVC
jgi:DNA-binding response OmpR family regulator